MKKKILVIDDSPAVRDNIRELLELSNYEVTCANNGKDGLECIKREVPDLILCDIMMPELDGYGVLRALNNIPAVARTPFIFLTSRVERDDVRKGMDLGADDYLPKPFTGDQLLSMVSARLRKAETAGYSDLSDGPGLAKPEDIYKISSAIIARKVSSKNMLYNEGEAAKYLYFVVSGKLKTYRVNDQGKEYITEIYTPFSFIGDFSLTEIGEYKDNAAAMTDAEVACIPRQEFRQILSNYRGLHSRFIDFLSNEIAQSGEKLVSLAYDSARKRVSQALLFLGQKIVGSELENVPFVVSRDDISAISGVSPESVSRNLSDFRAEKLIEGQDGKIKILNLARLNALKN